MKVTVESIAEGKFEVSLLPHVKVQSLQEQVMGLFLLKGVQLPNENKLVHKGNILDCAKTVQESGIENLDAILFLYNLKEAIKTQNQIDQPEQMKLDIESEISIPKLEESLNVKEDEEPKAVIEDAQEEHIKETVNDAEPELPVEQMTEEQLERIAFIASQIDWNDFPMPNPEDLELMMATGFSKWRCQKALLLNGFDPEQALDWLCSNLDNPTLDDPLSTVQLAHIMMEVSRQMNENQNQVENQMTTLLKEAVANNKCTFTVTGTQFIQQKWYFCYTCGFVDSEGVCEACANTCHKDHSLSAVRGVEKGSGFYCDCGASTSCICNK